MLYRFQTELSNIDRGIYESLDFRLSLHPSETIPYLLTRALAYNLSYQANLEFSQKGLGDPDTPALQASGVNGGIDLWIDIGNPSTKRLHKASKAAKQVVVYTYKSPELLINEINSEHVHRGNEIHIYSFTPKFLADLEETLEKNNRWSVLIQDGVLSLDVSGVSLSAEIKRQLPQTT